MRVGWGRRDAARFVLAARGELTAGAREELTKEQLNSEQCKYCFLVVVFLNSRVDFSRRVNHITRDLVSFL